MVSLVKQVPEILGQTSDVLIRSTRVLGHGPEPVDVLLSAGHIFAIGEQLATNGGMVLRQFGY